MATRAKPVEDDNWTDTPRGSAERTRPLSEAARRIAAKNTVPDEDDDVVPARESRRQKTEPKPAAEKPEVVSSPSPQPRTATFKKQQAGDVRATYKLSTVCRKALELCCEEKNTTQRNVLHEALLLGIDKKYFELAEIYAEIQAKYKAGVPLEQLQELRDKLGTLTKKTRQRISIEGTTVRTCIVTSANDDQTLEFYSRETGIPRGLVVEQCLRAYLKDYIEKADELIAFLGIL